ncbi:hypothetical protein KA531_00735 [Candidatus Saccharibacteria bacterium]|nr:hypothetical protein [Candidatus Saccharibacteria bacterium]
MIIDQFSWTIIDFVAAIGLLTCFGLMIFVIFDNLHRKSLRILTLIMGTLVLAYIWAELAVGIFTNLGN